MEGAGAVSLPGAGSAVLVGSSVEGVAELGSVGAGSVLVGSGVGVSVFGDSVLAASAAGASVADSRISLVRPKVQAWSSRVRLVFRFLGCWLPLLGLAWK